MLHDTFQRWLENARTDHGDILVANAWKIDFDNTEGFFIHIALVVDGPTAGELQAMEFALGDLWRSMAGGASYLMCCKAEAMGLEYRSGGESLWNHSLSEELHAAAIYLAGTDSFWSWEFADKPPSHGHSFMSEAEVSRPTGRRRAPAGGALIRR